MFENSDSHGLAGALGVTHQPMSELAASELSATDVFALARRLSETHAQLSGDSIVLYAGTNQASRAVETMLGNSMGACPQWAVRGPKINRVRNRYLR